MNIQNFTVQTLAAASGTSAASVTSIVAAPPTSADVQAPGPYVYWAIAKAPHAAGTQILQLQGSVEETPTNWFNVGPAAFSTTTTTAENFSGITRMVITDATAGVLRGAVPRHLRWTAALAASSGTNNIFFRIENP